ncbi:MAG: Crp/Fnr family transcriptional regulator [Lutibacter sp.]
MSHLSNTKLKLRKSVAHNLKLVSSHKKTKNLFLKFTYEPGDLIVNQNEKIEGLYFIVKGSAKIFKHDTKNPVILRMAQKGDILGLSSFNFKTYWTSAQAVTKCKVYLLSKKNVNALIKDNPKLGIVLIKYISFYLLYLETRLKHISLFNVEHRMIDSLLMLANEFGEKKEQYVEISTFIKRKELGELANARSETVIRELKKLEKKGLIKIETNKIIILNQSLLINLLKESLFNKLSREHFNHLDSMY